MQSPLSRIGRFFEPGPGREGTEEYRKGHFRRGAPEPGAFTASARSAIVSLGDPNPFGVDLHLQIHIDIIGIGVLQPGPG